MYIKSVLFFLCMSFWGLTNAQIDYVSVSVDFLTNIKEGKSTERQEQLLFYATLTDLQTALDTDEEKLVFWINIYNGFIQKQLKENPSLYENRGRFFKDKSIPIMGIKLSFADIEHGMIRKSKHEYFLGYYTKFLVPKYEKILRVKNPDYRIHFALNCGAKDCPPVKIYTLEGYESQIESSTSKYLKRISIVDEVALKVKTTPLMSWFRGDFGGRSGTKKILKKYEVIPSTDGWRLSYKDYDWTLLLDNYAR